MRKGFSKKQWDNFNLFFLEGTLARTKGCVLILRDKFVALERPAAAALCDTMLTNLSFLGIAVRSMRNLQKAEQENVNERQ
jgi:hypothetical protein